MVVQVPMMDAAAISAALPVAACIEAMENALRALDRGDVTQPLRSVIHIPASAGSLYTMPAYIADPQALAVKLITIFHGNETGPLPTHQGIVVVFDPQTGRPSLLLDAARLTAIRTAAVSAVATRALARDDAAILAVLGTGVQARSHIEAIPLVRPIREVRVWGRRRERAELLAREAVGSTRSGNATLAVIVCDSAEEAVTGADVVCTATSAAEPVVRGRWLRPGVHINAIGSSTARARELDSAAVQMSLVFVDSVDAALTEAGDLLIPAREGATSAKDWTPIGAVLNGNAPGRGAARDVTLFKSVGLAIEDAAAAAHIAQQLQSSGAES
jgi:ornithine cyclodeaminase